MNQNLFNALERVCDFIALGDDMEEILRAVEKDRREEYPAVKGSILTNDPILLKERIQHYNLQINLEIRKKKVDRNKWNIELWRLQIRSMEKYL